MIIQGVFYSRNFKAIAQFIYFLFIDELNFWPETTNIYFTIS